MGVPVRTMVELPMPFTHIGTTGAVQVYWGWYSGTHLGIPGAEHVGGMKREPIAAYEHLYPQTILSQFPENKNSNFPMFWMGCSGKLVTLFKSEANVGGETCTSTTKEGIESVQPALTPGSWIRSHSSALSHELRIRAFRPFMHLRASTIHPHRPPRQTHVTPHLQMQRSLEAGCAEGISEKTTKMFQFRKKARPRTMF
jgi:hypothetical protein